MPRCNKKGKVAQPTHQLMLRRNKKRNAKASFISVKKVYPFFLFHLRGYHQKHLRLHVAPITHQSASRLLRYSRQHITGNNISGVIMHIYMSSPLSQNGVVGPNVFTVRPTAVHKGKERERKTDRHTEV